jgi:hypothetical protein
LAHWATVRVTIDSTNRTTDASAVTTTECCTEWPANVGAHSSADLY